MNEGMVVLGAIHPYHVLKGDCIKNAAGVALGSLNGQANRLPL